MNRILFFTLFVFCAVNSYTQTISGTVKDVNGNVLSYASVTVKGTSKGAITNSEGKYTVNLSPGIYTLVCQYVGYKKQEKLITLTNKNFIADFSLSVQEVTMQEVIVKRGDDPALEIIRKAIKKRDDYNKQVDSFTVDVYIKGLLRSKKVPDRVVGQRVDKKELQKSGLDSLGRGILFLSESQTKVSYKKPDTYKYEVISSRQAGGGYGISFPFFINFYTNNVEVFKGLNPRGFISPIADNAFHYYKFHYEGSFTENNQTVDKIKVTPRRKNEPLFNGYIQIVDGEWRIHSLELTLTKDQQLELIDTARITQMHSPIAQDIWKPQNQVVYLAANTFGFQWSGNFLNVYSNYNLNPGFTKKTFNRTIMKYDTAFNKKDTAYWSFVRPVPLEPDEKKDFILKDSLYKRLKDSMFTKISLDSFNKKQPPVTFKQLLNTGIQRHHFSKNGYLLYKLNPLIFAAQFNTVEGLAADIFQSINFTPRNGKKQFYFNADTRYGFSNHHFNAFGTLGIKPKRNYFNHYLQFSGGKRVSQFNRDNPIDPFTNTVYSLFYKKNYMKIYENRFAQIEYNSSLENGLKWNVNTNYEDRFPLQNTTDFSFREKNQTILPNHPYELANIPFNRNQALVTTLTISYQPGQRYIELPDAKISVGSKYPTLQLQYSKGIKNVLGSDADFDKWRFSVYDNMNFKLGGEFRYRIAMGGFLNAAQVDIPDFQHFNGNQTYNALKYLNSFQLAPYYRYSNTAKLYTELHAEHHFNGLLSNKIPLFNQLKWNFLAGANILYINHNNYYAEAFAGVENIFKIMRVDFIWAYQAEPGRYFAVRMGFGGVIGDALHINNLK